jgi:pyridoxine 5-phosphate synthase
VTPIRLGVNVDHVATVRQARRETFPDPVELAVECELAGADSIVAHLREDRRHIQDDDALRLKKRLKTFLNLEMGLSADVVGVALRLKPRQVTLVPEKRQELTTEGGLDVVGQFSKVRSAVRLFQAKGVAVSLFIDPDLLQVEASRESGATIVELHTGTYSNARRKGAELRKLKAAARQGRATGLAVAAGHGLTLANVHAVAAIPEIEELNIGFSIVANALRMGMANAVRAMKRTMDAARR